LRASAPGLGGGGGKVKEDKKCKRDAKDVKDKKAARLAEEAERMEELEKTKKLIVATLEERDRAPVASGAVSEGGTDAEGGSPVVVKKGKGAKALRSANPAAVVDVGKGGAGGAEDVVDGDGGEEETGVGGEGEASKKKKKKKKKASGGAAAQEGAGGDRHVTIAPEATEVAAPKKIERRQTGIPQVQAEGHVAFDEAAPAAGAAKKKLQRVSTGRPVASAEVDDDDDDEDEDVAESDCDEVPSGPATISLPPSRHVQGWAAGSAAESGGPGGMLGLGVAVLVALGVAFWIARRRAA
jgi:hypothetical protein